jgi:hypothetical protein
VDDVVKSAALRGRSMGGRCGGTIGTLAAMLVAVALALLPADAAALGPKAPFVPPRASAAPGDAGTDVVAALAPGAAPSGAPAAAAAPGIVDGASASPLPGVAGIRLGGGAAMALIDGQWWRTGSRPRGARLASVTRQGAQLVHDDGRREFLPLLPPPAVIALSPPLPSPALSAPPPAHSALPHDAKAVAASPALSAPPPAHSVTTGTPRTPSMSARP